MGIWLFDEKERQLALKVLQSILTGNSEDEEAEEDDQSSNNSAQLKSISVADLLGANEKEKPPSILEILSKAKTAKETTKEPTNEPVKSLENAILDNFEGNLSASVSLESFTSLVCEFLQETPQILAALHRKLTNNKKRS